MLRLKLPGTWKHVPSRDGYEFVVVWLSFRYVLLDSGYHTDFEQMLKKNRQNIPKNGHYMLETSCKVGLQPEGGNYRHSETVIN